MKDWIRVYSGTQLHEIEIIRAALNEQEIDSVVIDKRDSNYIWIGDLEIYVHANNSILANVIIKQLEL